MHINQKNIFNIQPDVWIICSMTNEDIEYSDRRQGSVDNNNDLDISLYVCTCHDFKK